MEAEKLAVGAESEDVESNTIEPTSPYTLPERPKLPKWRLVCLVIRYVAPKEEKTGTKRCP